VERPGDLQSQGARPVIEVVTDAARPPVELLASIPGIESVEAFGSRAHLRPGGLPLPSAIAAIEAALAAHGRRALSVRPVPPSLEDIFIELIAGAS
jgi:hypothetical protein